MITDILRKMETKLEEVVKYKLNIHGENILMNNLIGNKIKIEWS